jgi:hypothetical protein
LIDLTKREIKSSHFNIGKVNGDMVNPKPISPFEKDVSGINFFIDD